jgi:glycosyltransferase involved in cell wall biosynthesis
MKSTILIFADYYLPGFIAGGALRSVTNIVEQLSTDFDWLVVTRDRDLGEVSAYPGVTPYVWTKVGHAQVFYVPPTLRSLCRIMTLLREERYDAVYLNSFFSFKFSILPVVLKALHVVPNRSILIAPRGEFSAGALKIRSWKKRAFLRVGKLLGFYRGALWHASTNYEMQDIEDTMPRVARRVYVASDLVPSYAMPAMRRTGTDRLKVCFLSRISRIKNLSFALQVLSCVAARVDFTIYGPIEDYGYWKECESAIATMPENVRVQYEGAVPHQSVIDKLAEHDLFFLPSRGENFGHVFVEAWAAGLPVLISDQTPWHGLEELGVGWDLTLADPEPFARIIDGFSYTVDDDRKERVTRCQEFAKVQLGNQVSKEANQKMFEALVERAGV